MKTKFFLVIIVCSLLSIYIVDAQSDEYNKAKVKIKGGYKKCVAYSYKYKSGKLDIKSKLESHIYKYDDNGNMIDEFINTNGGELGDIKFSYKYDDKNYLIEIKGGLEGNELKRQTFKYDDKGYLMEYIDYGNDGQYYRKENYKYDDKGNETEKGISEPDIVGSPVIFLTSNKYDDKRNKTEEVTIYKGKPTNKQLFKYDENNNVIENVSNSFNKDGSISFDFFLKYKYDVKGNKMEMVSCKADGKVSYKYSYKYDDNRNIIEEIFFENLNKPKSKTEYVYSK